MKTSESIKSISQALLKAQRKIGAAAKDAKNPFFKSNYADLGSVMEAVKDPLNEEGITIMQPVFSRDGSHYVETVLLHESGEYISSEALKLELNKVDMQQLGSAVTYAKRYQLQALGFVPSEDDDGEKSMNRPAKTFQSGPPKQVVNLTEAKPALDYSAINSTSPTPTLADVQAGPSPVKSGFGGFKASKPKTELF